ncbi:MAG: beta-phosphoglucomutase [Tenericutes bacterium HGW-Tenericutes-1]|nr:MAG: beta-phosphoglucomutase [Tenericutes bacterium HGW-Tenericutes-1]
MMIKAVIFDLDGVIVSTDNFHYQAWKHIADKEGIHFDELINNRLRGVSRMDSLDIILENSHKKYKEMDKIRFANEKNSVYGDFLSSLTSNDILPGVKELIALLKAKDIRLGVGSSSRNCKKILTLIGLHETFDVVIDGNDISRSKPDSEVFDKVAKKLGVEPEECLVIEDAIAGIEAAVNAGMMSFALNDAKKSPLATYKGNNVIEIASLL